MNIAKIVMHEWFPLSGEGMALNSGCLKLRTNVPLKVCSYFTSFVLDQLAISVIIPNIQAGAGYIMTQKEQDIFDGMYGSWPVPYSKLTSWYS